MMSIIYNMCDFRCRVQASRFCEGGGGYIGGTVWSDLLIGPVRPNFQSVLCRAGPDLEIIIVRSCDRLSSLPATDASVRPQHFDVYNKSMTYYTRTHMRWYNV